ncbi:MAG: 16S rRNA (guanine(527)-N(7))-methyltransferase RsmG [Pseudomonadales bacterium]
MDRAARIAGAHRLGVTLTDAQWTALEDYVSLLLRWNARFNLISRRDAQRVWSRHILDSLSVLPILEAECRRHAGRRLRALDLGSGAGLPGLPLAVGLPDVDWLLVDRNRRKVRFLELAAATLTLANVSVRALDLGRETPDALCRCTDVLVSRAVAAPAELLRVGAPMVRAGGLMVLLSGAEGGRAGKATAPGSGDTSMSVQYLDIPGLDQAHEVTIIRAGAEEAPGSGA